MRAVVLEEYGGPDVLQATTVADPTPAPGECIVAVEAVSVEFGLDGVARSGRGNWPITFPHVLGPAVVGRVVGAADTGPTLGDRVAVVPPIVCERCRSCLRGAHNSCSDRRIVGIHRWGGYAELVSVPSGNLITLAESMDPVLAAPLVICGVTAWHLVVQRARVGPADTVLVVGASGNVGYLAAQVAARSGARVLLAARRPADLADLADRVGADAVVSLEDGADAAAQVAELTGGTGVDVVVDTVGAATWPLTSSSIASEGRIVTSGGASGPALEIDLPSLYRRNVSLLTSSQGTKADAHAMFAAAARGSLTARVGEVLPLEAADVAHEHLVRPRKTGRSVLSIAS